MIYFDNAATTFPKPESVISAVNTAIRSFGGNPGRGGHQYSRRALSVFDNARAKAAQLFGSSPERTIFTPGCTYSLNFIIRGLKAKGKHFVISDIEHNSVYKTVHSLVESHECSYDVAVTSQNPEETVYNIGKLINRNTVAVICTHAGNLCGEVLPIKEIGIVCRARRVHFIVDAAQTAGLLPINLDVCDAIAAPSHKGLYGIAGIGLLAFNSTLDPPPIITGGTGSYSGTPEPPPVYPDRLEAGTMPTYAAAALSAGIDFVSQNRRENIYKKEFDMCAWLYQKLKAMPHISLLNESFEHGFNTPTVSFNIGDLHSSAAASRLDEHGFALRGGFHCSALAHAKHGTLNRGAVRFSPSAFSRMEHVEELVWRISKMRM
jgi:Selenocysteine lyase